MARYLDPKNDLIFKRIFGEHPHLLISFLNALIPLPPNRLIKSVEYLSPEQVPENPLRKNSIVNVKCIDNHGRHFIVEMQVYWSDIFKSRMVFNDSKAYVRQIRENKSYHLLQPVYGLGIICDAFDHTTEEFYHHYQTISWYNTEEVIEGLEFVLVELEKFKPSKWEDRKMAVLWLRFLSEVEDETRDVPADLLENKEIREALSLCEKSAFTSGELELYDQYWDYIRTMKGIVDVAKAEGLAKRKAEELAKALERTVLTAYQNKLSIEQIQAFSNLSKDDIFEILKRNKIV